MKAIILAAGLGQRMGALTQAIPKPLLEVGDRPLIVHHIERLVAAGINELVINHARHADQFHAILGDGSSIGADIVFSSEGDQPLGTAGGILKALPALGQHPFIVLNADLWTAFPFETLAVESPALAHLILVPNPSHHPNGDFGLDTGHVSINNYRSFTYAGIGCYRPELFAACRPGWTELAPLLSAAAAQGQVSGMLYSGVWLDVGTPERLAEANTLYANSH